MHTCRQLPTQLSEKYERNNLVLYRDDELTIFRNVSEPVSKKIKKCFSRLENIILNLQFNAIKNS